MDDNENDDGTKKVPWLWSCRVRLAIAGFFGFLNLYALRINMSVAMVCMVNQTALVEYDVTIVYNATETHDLQCYSTANQSVATQSTGEFVWPKSLQGIILGSFFWGYLVTQFPGGWLATRFGGRRVFGYFMLMSALATLMTPVASRLSPYLLITLRIVVGLGSGVAFPAMQSVWSKWAPPLERSTLIAFAYAGCQMGSVLTLPISGLFCQYGFDGGWPTIFYVFGAYGVVWCIAWLLFTSDSPDQHPRISAFERKYIKTALCDCQVSNATKAVPWMDIARSRAVWAIIITHTTCNWGTYTLLTNIPTYMREVLKFEIKSNGLLSAVPFLAFGITSSIAGALADFLRTHGWGTANVRKLMQTFGMILPGGLLLLTGYISCAHPYIAVSVLSLATASIGMQYGGFVVNHADIAPAYAGILFGISNTIATIPGFIAPAIIGVLTVHQTQEEWQHVFYLAAVIYVTGWICYLLIADGEIQPWARAHDDRTENATDEGTENDVTRRLTSSPL